jgi:[acyl-carrier-protein] S-malonyltransferase
MKMAFLFAGQGAQKVGMGLDISQHSVQARAFLDTLPCTFDVKKLIFEGPSEQLNQTEFTQVSVLSCSLMIAEALSAEGIQADAVAGLSLGEYSALTYAQVFTLEEVIPLIQARGLLMAQALPSGSSGMAAILNTDVSKIQTVLLDPSVRSLGMLDIANYNSPTQTVISGQIDALHEALSLFKAQGIRAIKLNVSGAFHSRLLKDSSVQLENYLNQIEVKPALKDVYFNIDGKIHTDVKKALTQQIYNSVHWVKTIQQMMMDGVTHFVEIGPGNSLTKFVQAIDASVFSMSIETMEDIKRLKGVIHG